MIEVVTMEEATAEKLEAADVILTIGWGDPQAPRVLCGRKTLAKVAPTKETADETVILRVKVTSDEEYSELKDRVKEAKGELDPAES